MWRGVETEHWKRLKDGAVIEGVLNLTDPGNQRIKHGRPKGGAHV